MRIGAAAFVLLALAAGCSRSGSRATGAPSPGRLPSAALDQQIGQSIGDPTTCVLIIDEASGKTLYQYGASFNCERPFPACDRPGTLTAKSAARLAATPGGRQASCNLAPDGSRSVGWAEGKVLGAKAPLIYSAVMAGERALPGHEMSARMDNVFYNLSL